MRFTKMHGLGNDYIYVDLRSESVPSPAELARAVSDRHTGIGGDGLILLAPSTAADVRMEMYNADGSRGEMCGNGIRCVAKYAVEHRLAQGPELTIETDAGVRRAFCILRDDVVDSVRIDMGEPVLAAPEIPTTIHTSRVVDHPIRLGRLTYRVTCVSMGNPHAVVFLDEPEAVDPATVGPRIENAPEFPARINVHFVRVDSPEKVSMRTWERGSGITRACGTGACAVCVAGALTRRTGRRIRATLAGGDLLLEWAKGGHVLMTGPAVEVFSGIWPD